MLQKQKKTTLTFLLSFSFLLFCTWGHAETMASKSPFNSPSTADSSKENTTEQPTTRDPSSLPQSKTNIASEGMAPAEAPSQLWAPEWRAQWGEKGIAWEAFVFWNGFNNQKGGMAQGGLGFTNFDLMINFDLAKLINWEGYSTYFQYHYNGLGDPANYVGDASGINAFALPYSTSLIAQAYLKKESTEGGWSFLLGLYDFSSEFFYNESAVIFLNNSFTGQLDLFPPTPYEWVSMYPINGPGLRFKKTWNDTFYLLAGASTAKATDPDVTSSVTPPRWDDTTGSYHNIEVGYQKTKEESSTSKYLIGTWWINKNVSEIENPSQEQRPWGFYVMVDQPLSERLSAFLNLGKSNSKVNDIGSTMALGLNLRHLFSDSDVLGLGYSQAKLGAEALNNDPTQSSSETVFELLYRIEVIPGLTIMPDYQRISSPNFVKETNDAEVLSLHLELAI